MADWKTALQAIAPTVAGLFGGPLAAAGASLIGQVLLGKSGADATSAADAQEAVIKAMGTPDGLLKLKELELKAQELQAKLQVDLREQDLKNTTDARAMNVQLRDGTPGRLALVTIPLFFIMVASVLYGAFLVLTGRAALPESGRELQLAVATLVGSLITLVGQQVGMIYGFYFGGSLGSADKNRSLDAALQQLGQAAVRPGAPAGPVLGRPSPPGTTADDLNAQQARR